MAEDAGPLGFPLGPVRRAIQKVVGPFSDNRGQKAAPQRTTPLDEYVRGLAKFLNVPEAELWRSGRVREYARRFNMTDVLEERLRGLE